MNHCILYKKNYTLHLEFYMNLYLMYYSKNIIYEDIFNKLIFF